MRRGILPVSKRRYKVETAVYSIVNNIASIEAAFVLKESLVLLIDILEYGAKAVRVIDSITKAGSIDHR